jgi:serine/threonine protein kinase
LRCYAALTVIPKAAFPSDESREQFAREVQIAAGIRHRSLASVFPLELIEGSYVYAMEFCDGETLADRTMRSDRIAALDALKIANQIAAGLETASAAGLLHRNITADNILLPQEDDEISAKVLGLALPSRSALGGSSDAPPELDFRSPEEIAGKGIDVRSGIYSLGALLYFMEAGPEEYALFRARLLRDEAGNLFGNVEDFSHRIGMVVTNTACHDPQKRIPTFAELVGAIDRARTAPEQFNIQEIPSLPRKDDAPGIVTSPDTELPSALEVAETSPLTEIATKPRELRAGELMIPAKLLGVAQPGTVLRLNRVEAKPREQVVVCVGSSFRIGRSDDRELVTRFLPRSKANDKKTMRLSKKQVTASCEGSQILLSDGSGGKPSTNGSVFDAQDLSAENPIPLVKPGELKLANVYSIKVIPLVEAMDRAPAIANLSEWSGSVSESNPALNGAILFVPIEPPGRDLALWLFSTAAFGGSSVSPLDFTSSPKIGALRYFRGCFWIEQRSTESLLVDGLALGLTEIAPLTTGQTVEVVGSKYTVEIKDGGKHQKSSDVAKEATKHSAGSH